MIKVFALSLTLLMTITSNATAQVIPPTDGSTKPAVGVNRTFFLSNISSIGVDAHSSLELKLPGVRHEIKGLYQLAFNCPPNLLCSTVMPAPAREATVILRPRELANTPVKARVLNTCRRAIEGAAPGSKVLIQGRVTELKEGSRVIVHSIESCSVGSNPE